MKLSIKSKLLMSFGILIGLVVFSQVIFNIFFANQWYRQYKMEYMESVFYEIKETYNGDIEYITEIATEMEEAQNIRVLIYCDDEVLYVSQDDYFEEDRHPVEEPNLGENDFVFSETDSVEEQEVGSSGRPNRIEEGGLFAKAFPIRFGGQSEDDLNLSGEFEYEDSTILIIMSLPIASIESSVSFFTNSNIVIACLVLVFGMVITMIVAQSITKPIREIEKTSCKLANLEFGESASETSNIKEIASLGRSINLMSRELCAQMEELNLMNERLQQDVDYQKQMEQMRREFIANVSHEMKTPLAILQFYCANLKSDIEGLDKEYYYDTIIEETQRMDEMVKSLLDISFLENGLSKMDFEEIDFSEVAEHTVEKLEPLLKDYQLETEIEQGLKVSGDSKFLEQAMKNYITNAASHTDIGKKIRVSMKKDEETAMFSVYNEGSYIEDKQMERIWESFYKSDESRVRTINTNVGLGLYIVKSIMENHNGTYGVENKSYGVEFRFAVPLLP